MLIPNALHSYYTLIFGSPQTPSSQLETTTSQSQLEAVTTQGVREIHTETLSQEPRFPEYGMLPQAKAEGAGLSFIFIVGTILAYTIERLYRR